MHPAVYLVYLALAAFAIFFGFFRFQETRKRRALAGAAVAALVGVLLVLPESWIVNLIVGAGLGSSMAGAWLASLLHRPSNLAVPTYGALLLLGYALIVLARSERGARRGGKGGAR